MGADSALLRKLVQSMPDPLARMATDGQYEVQIAYTQVDRDGSNQPHFITHQLGVNSEQYFYPASTVKFPVALFALEKLAAASVSGLDRSSAMISGDNSDSVEGHVRKVFLVSDNEAYNQLYNYVGIDRIQSQLMLKGSREARIVHRLAIKREPRLGYVSNPVRFESSDGALLLRQPKKVSESTYRHGLSAKKGIGYFENGSLIRDTKNFSRNNSFPILEQQALLQQLIFPDIVPIEQRFALSANDRAFVLQAMSDFPREEKLFTEYQKYDDDYVKPLIGWHPEPIRDSLRCYNKSGEAYGFLIDNAYVVNLEQQVEFFLAVVVHVNANRIYNDDDYEYELLGYPFLGALGQVIHEFETKRDRPRRPDFSTLGR